MDMQDLNNNNNGISGDRKIVIGKIVIRKIVIVFGI